MEDDRVTHTVGPTAVQLPSTQKKSKPKLPIKLLDEHDYFFAYSNRSESQRKRLLYSSRIFVRLKRPRIINFSVSRHDIRPALLLCCALLLQGTWFWQIGFILHPPLVGNYYFYLFNLT